MDLGPVTTSVEFAYKVWKEDSHVWVYPAGGARAIRHCASHPDVWRVFTFQPSPNTHQVDGLVKHETAGWLMTFQQATQLAEEQAKKLYLDWTKREPI